ncbi:DUF4198 domain-containing protein [uncultured Desulfobacter sp.]|uniref:DUF4198 domain-containing protein n=1 Tax=uncultured Desulfobacter sp. TaxID=240139 RepID=UPI002AA6736C|nr:DUF4198 domain-containing protein [uncultured Desulfobacter sp.]
MKRFSLISVIILIFMISNASAHSLWINCFESHVHKPGHAMVSLGWGHLLPLDDILNSARETIAIERFELFDPAMNKSALRLPISEVAKPLESTINVDIVAADLATQKISLKENSAPGVYQLGTATVPAFYTQYIDKKGRKRLKMKACDEIEDIGTVLVSVKYQAFSKSFMTLKVWKEPQALGHSLEIIPRTDLSNLHVGDLVVVDVLVNGKPLSSSAKRKEYLTAASTIFGQADKFALFSKIQAGKAQFRVQSPGQWIISLSHKEDVTQDGALKDLYGKTNQVYNAASLTFSVK